MTQILERLPPPRRGAPRNGYNGNGANDDDGENSFTPQEPIRKAPKQKPKNGNNNGNGNGNAGAERQAISTIVVRSCAMCHDSTTATANGKGFVLTQGNVMKRLSGADKVAMIAELTGSTMPPRPIPPLAAVEKTRLLSWLMKRTTS